MPNSNGHQPKRLPSEVFLRLPKVAQDHIALIEHALFDDGCPRCAESKPLIEQADETAWNPAPVEASAGVQRYDIRSHGNGFPPVVLPRSAGAWVSFDDANQAIAARDARIAELEKDAKRLDWLCEWPTSTRFNDCMNKAFAAWLNDDETQSGQEDFRAAIDAARVEWGKRG